METLVLDALRFGHFFGIAVGLGMAVRADMLALGTLRKPVQSSLIGQLHDIHRTVFAGLAVLWVSGLGILYAKTGFDMALFSPKLMAKLVVVLMLTVNAGLIGAVALPMLNRARGQRFGEIAFGRRLAMASIAAVSGLCWVSALVLGSFTQLKPMPASDLMQVFAPMAVAAIGAAFVAALSAPLVCRKSSPAPDREWDPRNAERLGLELARPYRG